MAASSSAILFDAGNTRVKWAVKHAGVLKQHGAHAYADGDIMDALDQALATLPALALIGSVATEAQTAALTHGLERRGVTVETVHVRAHERVAPAYSTLESLGVDRWLAMLGARTLVPGAVVVADSGTAMTLDALDAGGTHLGGLIAPGHQLMQRALLRNTARIDDAEQPLPRTMFGRSTAAAVNAGSTYSLAALLDRFVAEATEELGEPPVVLITGGGRSRLARFAHCDVIEVPDLVLLGLASLTPLGDAL